MDPDPDPDLSKTGPYFFRPSEQNNLQKLNNHTKAFVIQHMVLVFRLKFHLGLLDTKSSNALVWEIGLQTFFRDNFEVGLAADIIKNCYSISELFYVVAGHACPNWTTLLKIPTFYLSGNAQFLQNFSKVFTLGES